MNNLMVLIAGLGIARSTVETGLPPNSGIRIAKGAREDDSCNEMRVPLVGVARLIASRPSDRTRNVAEWRMASFAFFVENAPNGGGALDPHARHELKFRLEAGVARRPNVNQREFNS